MINARIATTADTELTAVCTLKFRPQGHISLVPITLAHIISKSFMMGSLSALEEYDEVIAKVILVTRCSPDDQALTYSGHGASQLSEISGRRSRRRCGSRIKTLN